MITHKSHLTERQKEILTGVLAHFVETSEAIGSKTLAQKYVRNFSPATIRNELAALTEMGYLRQPHTSAGRVPTDRSYRFYVDQVKELPPLSNVETQRIRSGYGDHRPTSLSELLEQTSHLLAALTHQASLVLRPNFSKTMFSQVRLVKISARLVYVIVVAKNGIVQNRPIEMDEELSQDFLDKISRYLNDEFRGLSLREVRRRISVQLLEHKREFDLLYKEALKLGQKAFLDAEGDKDEFFLGGTSHIFDQPEFQADMDKLRALFDTFEEKETILQILDKCMEAEGVFVSIGDENEIESMKDCAIITMSYGDGSQNLGTLGVVGPKRMQYPRIMALVDKMATTLSQVIATHSVL